MAILKKYKEENNRQENMMTPEAWHAPVPVYPKEPAATEIPLPPTALPTIWK